MLMNYLNTFSAAKLRHYAGDMQLHFESDTVYLILPRARSQIAGYFYLSTGASLSKVYAKRFNAPLHTECNTIKNLVSSAA